MKQVRVLLRLSIAVAVCVIAAGPLSFAKDSGDYSFEEFRRKMRQQGLFDETVMVPMRDGAGLSTTVFKSPLGGPYPCILVRTPYGKDDGRLDALQLVILQGYALAIQDVRGQHDSEGDHFPFVNDGWGELQDGYDTIEWIAAQSWCDGKVGTWGPSAMGIVQSLVAPTRPPHLVCQVIGYAASEGYGQAAYQNGVFREALVNSWLNTIGAIDALPVFRAHPTFDDLWGAMDVESKYEEINVPSMFIGGWYDIFLEGTLNDFVGRQTRGMEGAKGTQKVFIGPWTHTNEWDQDQGQLTYPEDSQLDSEIEVTLDWFDYWLKGEQNDVPDMPRVHYFTMGDVSDANAPGNEWRVADSWPIEAKETAFYLQPDGSLTQQTAAGGSLEFSVNPESPVPTTGGANLNLPAGPYDQSALEGRGDVLVFSTPSLEKPLEATGKVHLTLYAESNLTDNDITVRLTDVYPDGRSMLVCDGVARASFRDSYTEQNPIEPGQVYAYAVDLWCTSLVFNAGHQIRIIVANTNYPQFELNPLYKQLGQDGVPAEATTKLHLSADYPSSLYLPVVGEDTNVNAWNRY